MAAKEGPGDPPKKGRTIKRAKPTTIAEATLIQEKRRASEEARKERVLTLAEEAEERRRAKARLEGVVIPPEGFDKGDKDSPENKKLRDATVRLAEAKALEAERTAELVGKAPKAARPRFISNIAELLLIVAIIAIVLGVIINLFNA